jgi:3-oxoacyl-[acyl-carrier protein] reductase
MSDQKRHALITGASRGIGAAIAIDLAKDGHQISVNYNSHQDDANEIVKQIESIGGEARAVKGNVSDSKSVNEMVKKATDNFGSIEILVNNAGIISDNLLLRMKEDEFDKVIDTNLKGTFYCSKACVPSMVKNRWGRIINITSVVGIRGNIGQTNYSASKGAIHSFTFSLAKELSTRGVTVNAIAPGGVEFDQDQIFVDKYASLTPMKRMMKKNELNELVEFLCNSGSSYMTGSTIIIDGGWTAW